MEARRSENKFDSEDLRADQEIGGTIEGEEDKCWTTPVCFNRCLSEDLLCARPWTEAEEETKRDRHSPMEKQP